MLSGALLTLLRLKKEKENFDVPLFFNPLSTPIHLLSPSVLLLFPVITRLD